MRGQWMRAIGNRLRHNLTTRLIILLMLALMVITGFTDYTRLVREREQLVTQTQEDERIFAETLALGRPAEPPAGPHDGGDARTCSRKSWRVPAWSQSRFTTRTRRWWRTPLLAGFDSRLRTIWCAAP